MPAVDRELAIDALRDLNFAVDTFRATVAHHFGVGVRETQAVAYLVVHGNLTAGRLAEMLRLTPGSVTNLLDRLERADLVTRTNDPTDQRRLIIEPTADASKLVAEVRSWLDRCMAAVPDIGAAVTAFRITSLELAKIVDELRP